MQTPWGELRVADAHVHFFSRKFFQTLATQAGVDSAESLGPLLGWEIPLEGPEHLADRWVDELDRNKVDRAVLIASVPGDQDSVASAVARHRDRFVGYFMLNPTSPDAVAIVSGALANGLRGLCFFPAMHGYSMQDPRVRLVLDEAIQYAGTEVFVHCGVLTVGVRKKLGLPSVFDLRYSNPLDLIPVAARFATLPFVLPHFGAGYFREALMLADLCPNVSLDTSSSNSWMRFEGLDLQTVFRRSLDVLGPKRLRFGSDSSFFPRGWHRAVIDSQIQTLSTLGLSKADAAAILGGNLPG